MRVAQVGLVIDRAGSVCSCSLGGSVANKILSGCGASCTMQELMAKYILLENYFMSESLSKVRMCCMSFSHCTCT